MRALNAYQEKNPPQRNIEMSDTQRLQTWATQLGQLMLPANTDRLEVYMSEFIGLAIY